MTKEEQIEKKLLEYHVLTQRLDALSRSAEKDILKKAALSLRPSDNMTQDVTRPKVQTSSPQSWVLDLEKAFDRLNKRKTQMCDDMIEILDKQADIKLMVDRARLDEKEKLYCELRYFQGKMAKVVEIETGLGESACLALRKKILEKINTAE